MYLNQRVSFELTLLLNHNFRQSLVQDAPRFQFVWVMVTQVVEQNFILTEIILAAEMAQISLAVQSQQHFLQKCYTTLTHFPVCWQV